MKKMKTSSYASILTGRCYERKRINIKKMLNEKNFYNMPRRQGLYRKIFIVYDEKI